VRCTASGWPSQRKKSSRVAVRPELPIPGRLPSASDKLVGQTSNRELPSVTPNAREDAECSNARSHGVWIHGRGPFLLLRLQDSELRKRAPCIVPGCVARSATEEVATQGVRPRRFPWGQPRSCTGRSYDSVDRGLLEPRSTSHPPRPATVDARRIANFASPGRVAPSNASPVMNRDIVNPMPPNQATP